MHVNHALHELQTLL